MEGFHRWLEHWVHGVENWEGFLARVGHQIVEDVRIKHPLLSKPLDYGA